jgi:glucose/arabinose dehydrogenase
VKRSTLAFGRLALVIAGLAGVGSCSEGATEPTGGDVSLRIGAVLSVATVSLVVLEVTAEDIATPLVFNFPVVDGAISGTITGPAGSDRTLTAHAYDEGGTETHRGAVTIDLPAGTRPTLNLQLFPLASEQPITVTLSTLAVNVSPSSVSLTVGATTQLSATITDASGAPVDGTVRWATLNPGVATVDASGLVTAKGTGEVQVVATFGGVGDAATVSVFAGANPSALLVASGFSSPIYATAPPGDASRVFVVDQPGTIWVVKGGTRLSTPFLDITSLVLSGGEQGLLSMAFHPEYSQNGFFYVFYTSTSGGEARVVRYRVSSNPDVADAASAVPVLAVPQPAPNHNGGQLQFGPDGMLYVALGDGGGSSARVNAQDIGSLLGKILRLDVDAGAPYAVPPDNPLVGTTGARGEIWALGLRNPWRFSFDAATGDAIIADVGENAWEEVNLQPAGVPAGRNFGWPIMEGSACFGGTTCDQTGLTTPIHQYSHLTGGGCSITGGYVYRGTAVAALAGHYLYADYCQGWVRSFRIVDGQPADAADWSSRIGALGQITSFGVDALGEIYFTTFGPTGGALYKIVPSA